MDMQWRKGVRTQSHNLLSNPQSSIQYHYAYINYKNSKKKKLHCKMYFSYFYLYLQYSTINCHYHNKQLGHQKILIRAHLQYNNSRKHFILPFTKLLYYSSFAGLKPLHLNSFLCYYVNVRHCTITKCVPRSHYGFFQCPITSSRNWPFYMT